MDKQSENHKEEIIKALRKELVSSEIRFQKIITHNSIPILIVSQDGFIRFANPAAEYLFHKTKEKLINQNFGYPLLHDEAAEIIITAKNHSDSIAEMRVVETVWEEEPVFLVSLRDVTERRNMIEKLRIEEERYRSLVELSPFGIFVHVEGICVFANTAGIRLLGGQKPDEIIGQSVMRFVHPDYRDIVTSRIGLLYGENRQLLPIEEKFIRLDGSVIDVEVSGIKFDYMEKVAIQLVVVDITERKKVEVNNQKINTELQKSFYQKTKELDLIHLELDSLHTIISNNENAPLRSIHNSAETLTETLKNKLDSSEKFHLENIKRQAANTSYLIESLLILTNLAEANMEKETINVSLLCKDLMNDINRLYSNPNMELSFQSNLTLKGNPKLIRIALFNLLENAVKFSRNSSSTKIEIASINKDGNNVLFIRDNGMGFSEENEKNIFRPFYKLEPSEGLGMGLTIVNHIFEKHNGKVWAKSQIGIGSTFYFYTNC